MVNEKMYPCPYPDCNMTARLDNIFQHIHWKHELKERYVVIDTVAQTLRLLTARSVPAELKEQLAEVPA